MNPLSSKLKHLARRNKRYIARDAAAIATQSTTRATASGGISHNVTSLLHAPMTVGEVFLQSLSTGVITEREMAWLTTHQGGFSREEEATALRLGRLCDAGEVNLGCRISSKRKPAATLMDEWLEPLGRRRHQRPMALR